MGDKNKRSYNGRHTMSDMLFEIGRPVGMSAASFPRHRVDSDSGSSDGIEYLRRNLPHTEMSGGIGGTSIFADIEEDEFTQWQMNRYGRIGSVNIYATFKLAARVVSKHFDKLAMLYVPYACLYIAAVRYRSSFLFVMVELMASIVASSASMSLATSQGFTLRARMPMSMSGAIACLLQVMKSLVYWWLIVGLMGRTSRVPAQAMLLLFMNYATLFYWYFLLEGVPLSFGATISFPLRLSFFTIPALQSCTVFLLAMFLQILAPLTLGFTGWIAYVLRACAFLAFCGSGTNTSLSV